METAHLEKVAGEIGKALQNRDSGFLVVVRSTVVPGTVRKRVLPILEEHSEARAGAGFDVVFHPEFLREGSSVWDFDHPSTIVLGEHREGAAEPLLALYDGVEAPRFLVTLEEAELVKYANNAFHAAKVTFANEIGHLGHTAGVDSRKVMEILCSDGVFNISPHYLRPGFAFGGSCLPKDLRALLAFAGAQAPELPMLGSILDSNRRQVDRAVSLVMLTGKRRIGIHGLAFKPGTDDLRESPLVELAERLLGKGCEVRIFDEGIKINRLMGGNKAFIDLHFPHLAELLCETLEEVAALDLVILGHELPRAVVGAMLEGGSAVLDLTGRNLFPERDGYSCIV
jgi:GDP-mannose 6-dehydrogenase